MNVGHHFALVVVLSIVIFTRKVVRVKDIRNEIMLMKVIQDSNSHESSSRNHWR